VARIVLVDTAWPLNTDAAPAEGQISWEHIVNEGWPIPLVTRKQDIKKGRRASASSRSTSSGRRPGR
jgi:hypothetical protein